MARGPGFRRRTQDRMLKDRGLVRTGHGHLEEKEERSPPYNPRKTLVMRLIEQQHGRPIEELLMEGTEREVADTLQIAPSTVSKYRLRLGLRDGTSEP